MLIDSEKLKKNIKKVIEEIKKKDISNNTKVGINGGLELALLEIEWIEKE
nr:MAG TPA: hypothetical protein [Caudoviricetes sp.]